MYIFSTLKSISMWCHTQVVHNKNIFMVPGNKQGKQAFIFYHYTIYNSAKKEHVKNRGECVSRWIAYIIFNDDV